MTDFLILGGGMAGASAGYFLADHGSVVLLEKEEAPGYHSTGRSAALFTENYGSPPIRALTAAGDFAAKTLINAGGAWADEIAAMAGVRPIGLVPKRRTAFTFDPPTGMAIASWPLTGDLGDTFYFKPEAGRVFASPADE